MGQQDQPVQGVEGGVGTGLIGVAIVIVAYTLIRNENRRAISDGRQRRGSQVVFAVVVGLIGLALVVIGVLDVVQG